MNAFEAASLRLAERGARATRYTTPLRHCDYLAIRVMPTGACEHGTHTCVVCGRVADGPVRSAVALEPGTCSPVCSSVARAGGAS